MTRTTAHKLALTALLAIVPLALAAQSQDQGRPAVKPVLVELFTSEGCSSCPPADDLLRQVNGTSPVAGQLVVGISEHVTYWNRLGWADPFSADVFTRRQNGYGERFRLDDIYTPQMIINGREQIVGGNEPLLLDALKRQSNQPSVALQIVSVQRNGNELELRFRVGDLPSRQPLELVAVVTDDLDTSTVDRGENAGRVLRHVAVARSFERVATIASPNEKTVRLAFAPLTDPHRKSMQTLILFLQEPNLGAVLGSALQPIL